MVAAHVQQRRDRSTSAAGPPHAVAVDPLVGGRPTDAVASRQLRDVEHGALVIGGRFAVRLKLRRWTFTAKLADGQPFSSKGWESHVYQKLEARDSVGSPPKAMGSPRDAMSSR